MAEARRPGSRGRRHQAPGTPGWVIAFGAHETARAVTGAALVAVALIVVGVRILRASNAEFAAGEPE